MRAWWHDKGSPVITLLLCSILIGACVGMAARANATPQDKYIGVEGPVICKALTETPTLQTVSNLFRAIITDTGFTVEETAKVVVQSVEAFCPQNAGVLQRFVEVYGTQVVRA